jgi:hypothetical protein
MAEIKFQYKNCPEDQIAERDQELAKVKDDMEELKKQKIEDARTVMQGKLKEI